MHSWGETRKPDNLFKRFFRDKGPLIGTVKAFFLHDTACSWIASVFPTPGRSEVTIKTLGKTSLKVSRSFGSDIPRMLWVAEEN